MSSQLFLLGLQLAVTGLNRGEAIHALAPAPPAAMAEVAPHVHGRVLDAFAGHPLAGGPFSGFERVEVPFELAPGEARRLELRQ